MATNTLDFDEIKQISQLPEAGAGRTREAILVINPGGVGCPVGEDVEQITDIGHGPPEPNVGASPIPTHSGRARPRSGSGRTGWCRRRHLSS